MWVSTQMLELIDLQLEDPFFLINLSGFPRTCNFVRYRKFFFSVHFITKGQRNFYWWIFWVGKIDVLISIYLILFQWNKMLVYYIYDKKICVVLSLSILVPHLKSFGCAIPFQFFYNYRLSLLFFLGWQVYDDFMWYLSFMLDAYVKADL